MQNSKIDIQALLHLVRRRKWFIIVPLILASVGGYIRIVTLVSEYKSTSTVLLNKNLILTERMSNVLPGVEARDKIKMRDQKETLMKQLLSTSLLKQVVVKTGLKPSGRQLERAKKLVAAQPALGSEDAITTIQAVSLRRNIEVIFPRRGDYIEVSTSSSDPQKAYLVTKHLVDLFIENILIEELSNVTGTLKFSEAQMDIYRQEADAAEAKLRQFKLNMASSSDEEIPINPTNVEQVKKLISANRADISKKVKNSSALDRSLGRYASEIRIRQTRRAAEIKASLIEKLADLAKLMITHNWNSGDILRLRTEISSLKDSFANAIRQNGARELHGLFPENAIETAVQKEIIQSEITFLQAQQKTLGRLLESYTSHSTKLPGQEVTLQKLQADFEKYREMYQIFADQVRSAQITSAMQKFDKQIRYRIIDPAQLPTEPVNASTNQVILVALIMGIGIGAGFIYLLEFIDQSFKSVDEVENYLGLIVLGTVPRIDFDDRAQAAKKKTFSF
ncbi:MAG: GumC family protein [bacterium]